MLRFLLPAHRQAAKLILLSVDKSCPFMKTCNVIPAKAGIQSFAAPWMPRHTREGGDCAGMTILAAVMINSRLDSSTLSCGATQLISIPQNSHFVLGKANLSPGVIHPAR